MASLFLLGRSLFLFLRLSFSRPILLLLFLYLLSSVLNDMSCLKPREPHFSLVIPPFLASRPRPRVCQSVSHRVTIQTPSVS